MTNSTVEGVPDDVLERIQKIFSLAAKNPNEAEAEAAVAKGQELLERYNLSYEAVSGTSAGSGARERAAIEGGTYKYQQDLWRAVAEINFCWYWHERYWNREGAKNKYGVVRTWMYHHCLVGRKVNVAATRAMAAYLEQAASRIVAEHARGLNTTPQMSNWSYSLRRGVTDRICARLRERRRDAELGEAARAAEARKKTAQGASTSTALAISTYHSAEMDANYDLVFGEGWSAQQAAERAQAAAIRRMSQDEYTRWAAANPEQAAEAEERKRQLRRSRGGGSSRDSLDRGTYMTGYALGADVSIDQQVDQKNMRRLK